MQSMRESVASVFERLGRGELSRTATAPGSGWEIPFGAGGTVTRSALQAEAEALVALGREAVPHLLPYVGDADPALRYVAIHALERITGKRSGLPLLAGAERGGDRARALQAWRDWYESGR